MKATVREYTVKKKVVVVEIDAEEAERIARDEDEGGLSTSECGQLLIRTVMLALEADRAEEQRKEDEDVPF